MSPYSNGHRHDLQKSHEVGREGETDREGGRGEEVARMLTHVHQKEIQRGVCGEKKLVAYPTHQGM